MFVSIVIVSYRNPGDVVACLEALSASTYKAFDVVIVENGGAEACQRMSEATPQSLASGQSVRLVCAEGNLGFAGGVNLGIRTSPDAEAWWVLNPDTQPEPGALAALVARLEEGDCDAAGGPLLEGDGEIASCAGEWQTWCARAVSLGRGRHASSTPARSEIEPRMSFVSGASLLASRKFISTVGLMREDYFLYCEEVEWCLRAVAKGLKLGYAPEARVWHDQGATTGSGRVMTERPRLPIYLNERNRILLTRDCMPGRLALTAPVVLGHAILRYGSRKAWRQLGFAVAGWAAGLRNERGAPSWTSG